VQPQGPRRNLLMVHCLTAKPVPWRAPMALISNAKP